MRWLPLFALLMLSALPAQAQEPILRRIEFTGEVMEREKLESLLTLKPGAPLAPSALRETLGAFYQTGQYRSILAETGLTPEGLVLRFRFERQPFITGWEFKGNGHLESSALERAMELSWGQPLNPLRFKAYEQAIKERYRREGYLNPGVRIDATPVGPGEATMSLRIEEGTPLTLNDIKVIKAAPLQEPEIRSRLGLQEGTALRRESLLQGLDRLERALSETGYLNSRVSHYFELPDGQRVATYSALLEAAPPYASLVIAIEEGQRAIVEVDADELLPTKDLARALTVYDNRSYSPYELDASAEKLRRLYVSQGYPEARVTHAITRQDDGIYRIHFQVAAGTRMVVGAVDFEGAKSFPADTLRGILATRPPRPLLGGGVFDPDIWERDKASLLAFYEARGFLKAGITQVDRYMEIESRRLMLVVHLDEGPRSLVSRLRFSGVSAIDEPGLLQALPINPGEPYNPRRLGDYVASVEAYYAKTGYPLARAEARYEPQDGSLHFKVSPGPRKRLGALLIRGNLRTRDRVIERQLTLKPGTWYNSEELLANQQRVYQLGFFDRVNLSSLRPISQDPEEPIDLLLNLHERETGWVAVGGGLGDLQGPQGSVEYVQNNLLGTGRPLRLEGLLSAQRSRAIATLRDPALFESGYIGETGFSFLSERRQQGLWAQNFGPTVGLSRPFSDALLGSLRYSWTRTSYSAYTPEDLVLTQGALAYNTSLLTAGFTYDTRSDLISPRWGTKAELNLDLASRLLGGTLTYGRPRASLAYFWPLPGRWVLALGGELGFVSPFGDTGTLPRDVLFQPIGANSLRGDPLSEEGAEAGTFARAGRAIGIAHLETRFPILEDWGGVAFLDLGNVGAGWVDFTPGALHLTAGAGVRYQTPIGPLRFDYGFRLRPTPGPGQAYFGLGQAF